MKGSGGDLGTLTEAGLAVLRLDRLRALVDVYPGEDAGGRDGRGVRLLPPRTRRRGARRSTPRCTGSSPPPTSTTSTPTAASRSPPRPTASSSPRRSSASRCVWVPWRRPGFQLGLDIAAVHDANPQAVGVILGGHGITAWGATSDEAEANSRWIIETAQAYIDAHGDAEPFGAVVDDRRPLPPAERRAKAAALAPHLRAVASQDQRMVGHFTDSDVVLEFLAAREAVRARRARARRAPTTSCARRSSRSCSTCRRAAPVEECVARLAELHEQYRADYAAYYERHANARLAGDARRRPRDRARARRRHVLVRQGQADRPRRRRVLRQRDQRDARRRGALDLRADPRAREVPHRVLGARGGQAATPPEAEAPRRAHRARHRRRQRDRQGHRHPTRGRRRVRRGRRPRRRHRRASVAAEIGSTDVAVGVAADVTDAARSRAAVDATLLAFGGHRPRREQRRPVDLEAAARHDRAGLGPAARRDGQGQLPRRAGRGAGDDRPAPRRRHRLHRVEERAVRRARTTSPTARPRPTRRTRCGSSPPSSASTASG